MELKQKYGENLYNPNILEFKNVSKDILPWLEKVVLENNCRIDKKEWRSKYNSYVVYDYEPFCSDGFEISLTIFSTTRNHLKFIQYLYENKLRTLELLEICLTG